MPVVAHLPAGHQSALWRPTLVHWHPPGPRNLKFVVWWLFHWLRVFANRDYAVLVIYRGTEIVHRSSVFPGYFRFPFMAAQDLQIGDTWTAAECRGLGLATIALEAAVASAWAPGRVFWYVTTPSNVASVRVAEKAGFGLAGDGTRTKRMGLRLLGAFVLNSSRTEPR